MKPPYIVLANHNLNIDPILLAFPFPEHMYYVASEHVYRWGFASKAIAWLCAPIKRLKGSTDARTAMEVIRALRKGRSVCIFAEGNRSYNGLTGPIPPSTGKLVKAAGVPIILYKIQGGYFTAPRWGRKMRKGRMTGHVERVLSEEQLQGMSAGEVQAAIEAGLYEDAYRTQKEAPVRFKGKHLAEWLEVALYICPACHKIGGLHSEGSRLSCTCGMQLSYTEYGELKGQGCPFTTITEWDAWQVQELSVQAQEADFCLRDAEQALYSVEAGVGSVHVETGMLSMDRHALTCGASSFRMQDISNMAIYARMNIVFTTADGAAYEIRSKAPRNATKYLEYYTSIKRER